MVREEDVEYVYILCPHCRKINTAPITAGVNVKCSYCGKGFYTSGIEVQDKESSKIVDDLEKQRRKEIENGNQED